MEIRIAGRPVPVGSRLYSKQFDTFGTVTGYDPTGAAVLSVLNSSGARRTIYVQDGGMVNGVKMVYWHSPVVLDLPFDDITPIQTVVDVFSAEMLKLMEK